MISVVSFWNWLSGLLSSSAVNCFVSASRCVRSISSTSALTWFWTALLEFSPKCWSSSFGSRPASASKVASICVLKPSADLLCALVELGFDFVCLSLKLGFDEFRVGGGLLALEDSCADLDRLTDECVEALACRLALSSKRDRGVVIDCEAVNQQLIAEQSYLLRSDWSYWFHRHVGCTVRAASDRSQATLQRGGADMPRSIRWP